MIDQKTIDLVTECRDALAEEMGAWDLDPPLHHVKQAHDRCVAWLAGLEQAEPVVMQYIALCDAMRYSERKDELTSPEEHAESLVSEIERLELVAEIERLKQAEPVQVTHAMVEAAEVAHDAARDLRGRGGFLRSAVPAMIEAALAAQQQAEPVVDPSVESMLQAGRFCDANCTALDHHADCVIGNPSF